MSWRVYPRINVVTHDSIRPAGRALSTRRNDLRDQEHVRRESTPAQAASPLARLSSPVWPSTETGQPCVRTFRYGLASYLTCADQICRSHRCIGQPLKTAAHDTSRTRNTSVTRVWCVQKSVECAHQAELERGIRGQILGLTRSARALRLASASTRSKVPAADRGTVTRPDSLQWRGEYRGTRGGREL